MNKLDSSYKAHPDADSSPLTSGMFLALAVVCTALGLLEVYVDADFPTLVSTTAVAVTVADATHVARP